jgi:hypothetical protein
MDADPRILRLAQVVAERHGRESLAVVRERIRTWLEAEDYAWVAVWAQVAECLCTMPHELRQPEAASPIEAPFGKPASLQRKLTR